MPSPSAHRQYAIFVALAVAAVFGAHVLSLYAAEAFLPYFADISPPLAVAVAAFLGAAALHVLRAEGWFEILSRNAARGTGVSAALATCFAAAVILADIGLRYPRDINVAAPWSLLFYPVIGFVAEIVFHVAPLALLALLSLVVAKPIRARLLWPCMILVALLEPAFQLRATLSGAQMSWTDLCTGPHVFLFGLVELWVFRRYGFVPMLAFRLIYYLYWHITWGYLRLALLF